MNSIIQTGQLGLQQSYQRMNQAAHNIASAPSAAESAHLAESAPVNAGGSTGAPAAVPNASVQAAEKSQSVQPNATIEESVLELRRQQQVFTASANVVSVGQEMVGTLLDDYS